ncbi:MAG: DUF4062 domain-containing protein [Sedimentibacter saalensis]|uniref:DUF4062 domain-containing protein n=1 Tax=Sedimentibacter saalensis TaxID=130788 RepID=UPI00315832CB
MEKRYQVFVSSTFIDLQEERKEVMQALLELDCIPAGMELFPASNEEQWSIIKKVIDDCDYYILIIGGRYGSVDTDGMGYTEKEYHYAIETKKPVISFLHKDPGQIKSQYTEHTEDGREKLEAFRKLAQKKLTKYWVSAADLGSVVSRSMIKLIKDFPATGWVKSDAIMDENSIKEILRLQKENEELRKQIEINKIQAPTGTEMLAQGDDEFNIKLSYAIRLKSYNTIRKEVVVTISWNEVFSVISPYLVNECDELNMKKVFQDFLINKCVDTLLKEKKDHKGSSIRDFSIEDTDFQNIKIQFKALGLIKKSTKSRSVKDTGNYWTLTEYGDHIMTQLIAVRKTINY